MSRSNMSTYTLKPFVVDPDSLAQWKRDWKEIWDAEKDDSSVFTWNPNSEWVSREKDLPWCPYHFRFCVMDKRIRKLTDWSH